MSDYETNKLKDIIQNLNKAVNELTHTRGLLFEERATLRAKNAKLQTALIVKNKAADRLKIFDRIFDFHACPEKDCSICFVKKKMDEGEL